jgi:hypothetical protein
VASGNRQQEGDRIGATRVVQATPLHSSSSYETACTARADQLKVAGRNCGLSHPGICQESREIRSPGEWLPRLHPHVETASGSSGNKQSQEDSSGVDHAIGSHEQGTTAAFSHNAAAFALPLTFPVCEGDKCTYACCWVPVGCGVGWASALEPEFATTRTTTTTTDDIIPVDKQASMGFPRRSRITSRQFPGCTSWLVVRLQWLSCAHRQRDAWRWEQARATD